MVHVTASRFFGGPERQMVELARELSPRIETSFISFSEQNLCQSFLDEAHLVSANCISLKNDTPKLLSAARELRDAIRRLQADVLCTHGYKAGLLGLWAARRIRVPVVAVSRGWTAESWKVRLYERLDRRALRRVDRVVCVSHGQAEKVRHAGVPPERICVIHNAIRTERFAAPFDHQVRLRLEKLFPLRRRYIIGAAGRLSPEKGFDVLIAACQRLRQEHGVDDFGVVIFGEGFLRERLQEEIQAAGLHQHVVLAGFTSELDRFMPHFDVFAQASHTEGLPNVLLEAAAAGVPVVATNVGGTSEVALEGISGQLVPPNDPSVLAATLHKLLADDQLRLAMKRSAPEHVGRHFTFSAQAKAYMMLFRTLLDECGHAV